MDAADVAVATERWGRERFETADLREDARRIRAEDLPIGRRVVATTERQVRDGDVRRAAPGGDDAARLRLRVSRLAHFRGQSDGARDAIRPEGECL